MKTSCALAFGLTLAALSNFAHSQNTIHDLVAAIDAGIIEVIELRGTGSSTGSAIVGVIQNNSSRQVRINTTLANPLFLGNRSSRSRQNMIAFEIYQRDGGYYSSGRDSFIEVSRNARQSITLVAYCADYEKDNPTSSDQFSIAPIPANLTIVSSKISAYKKANPSAEITIAAQVALWLGQGLTPSQIRETFEFTAADEEQARRILRN